MSEVPSGSESPSAEMRYRIAGEGRELFSRMNLRDRIRGGEVVGTTEIATEGSEDYRPAAEYPELARYLSLLSAQETPVSVSTFVPGGASAPASPVLRRLVPGVLYPLTGLGSVLVLALSILELIPIGALLSGIITPLVCVAIVRVSSDGATTMPSFGVLGSAWQILGTAARVILLTILSAWPFILAILLTLVSPRGATSFFFAALIAMILYYPACVAILARYGTIRPALSVTQIGAFITTLGSDYIVALLAGFAVLVLAFVSGLAAAAIGLPEGLQSLARMIPLVWGTFYVFHLIGWGMHNRRGSL